MAVPSTSPKMGEPSWISSPILDLRYSQTIISTSPFGSAKQQLEKTESTKMPFHISSGGGVRKGGGAFSRKMSYPITLKGHRDVISDGFGQIRSETDIRESDISKSCTTTTVIDPTHLAQAQQPNPYWFHPPATVKRQDRRSDDELNIDTVVTDVLHPLISDLQARENMKAEQFNPNTSIIASPNRMNSPSPCRRVGGEDVRDSTHLKRLNDNTTNQSQGQSVGKPPRPGESESQGYNTDGGIYIKDAYHPALVAQSQNTSLTSIAARALASVIHSKDPANVLPSNAARAANRKNYINCGPKGTNANNNTRKGLHNSKNPVVPPSQAYRLLSTPLQGILRNRGPYTRSNIAKYLYDSQSIVRPPPVRVTEEDIGDVLSESSHHSSLELAVEESDEVCENDENASGDSQSGSNSNSNSQNNSANSLSSSQAPPSIPHEEKIVLQQITQSRMLQGRPRTFSGTRLKNCGADVEDATAAQEELIGEDEVDLLCSGSALTLWSLAVRSKMMRDCSRDDTSNLNLLNQVVAGAKLRIVTPQFVSAYNMSSDRPQFSSYLADTGLRMGDCLTHTQPAPKKKSQSANGKEKGPEIRDMMVFSDEPTTPSGAFCFDSSRLMNLLIEKGVEVEELYFEGMQWISPDSLGRVGDFCPKLKLVNFDRCDQLEDSALISIAMKCRLLAFVNVNNCHLVTAEGLRVLMESSPQLSILCCHSLPHLDLPNGRSAFESLHCCRTLQVLDISYCQDVDDKTLYLIAQYCPGLSHLDISGCHKVGDEGIRAIGGRLCFLKVLRLKLCNQQTLTPEGLKSLTQAPRNLKHLDISGVSQTNDSTLTSILCHSQSLLYLSVAGCFELTDTTIESVTRCCQQLRHLNISSCKQISLTSCMNVIYDIRELQCLVVSESSISNAEVVMLQSVREGCQVIRNQYRSPPATRIWTTFTPKRAEKVKKGKRKK